jgi:uncharacterized protein DUF3168
LSAVRDAIVKHLLADTNVRAVATGGIYPKMPPKGSATFPFIEVRAQKPPSGNRVFQAVAFEDSVFQVKACDQYSSPKRAADIAAAVRTSLDQAALTIDGYDNLGIIWIADIDMVEEGDGLPYHYEGGLYEVYAAPQ